MTERCVFCDIVAGKLPAAIIAENEHVMVIKDRSPKAPIHYLIILKKHVKDCASLREEDREGAAALLFMAQELAKQLPGSQSFRLLMNNGADAGQSVFHLHMHFISGKKLTDF